MRLEDVEIGMKVVPHSKSIGWNMETSEIIKEMRRRKQEYLYVVRIYEDNEILLGCNMCNNKDCGYFLAKDFEPYDEDRESKKRYLTYNEIRSLPHGTKIKFTDNYGARDKINSGIINQEKRMIAGFNNKGDIDNCWWYFNSLERREVKAWIEEPIKPKTQKETLELIFNGTDTIAILRQEDGKYKKGVSKLHPLDTYNKSEGIRVAVCKALGEPIKETKELEDYTIDELFEEIKRRVK